MVIRPSRHPTMLAFNGLLCDGDDSVMSMEWSGCNEGIDILHQIIYAAVY
jgi:hypothetical protein